MVMIWFGVIIAMNLQTSFLTPPFGFALFYLRSVAPMKDYKRPRHRRDASRRSHGADLQGLDRLHRRPGVHGGNGHAYPQLVAGNIDKGKTLDEQDHAAARPGRSRADSSPHERAGASRCPWRPERRRRRPVDPPRQRRLGQPDDPMKALLEAAERDKKK
jgi:hypothetical protein